MQWHTAKVQSLDDAKRMETSLAGTGPGSIAETVPRLLNALIGTRFKLISGYPASSEAMLAMERGEVEGASSSWAAVKVGKQIWLRERKIRIILQTTPERIAELPDAPSLGEIGDTPEDKQVFALYASGSAIGRSVIAPPGLPAERVAALRDAFQAMVKDPEFIAELQRTNVELDPLPGAQVEALVVRTLNVPATVRDRAKLGVRAIGRRLQLGLGGIVAKRRDRVRFCGLDEDRNPDALLATRIIRLPVVDGYAIRKLFSARGIPSTPREPTCARAPHPAWRQRGTAGRFSSQGFGR